MLRIRNRMRVSARVLVAALFCAVMMGAVSVNVEVVDAAPWPPEDELPQGPAIEGESTGDARVAATASCDLVAATFSDGELLEAQEGSSLRDAADPYAGTAYAVLTDAGELILFRSNESYRAGYNMTVTDIRGNVYTGRLYTGYETRATITADSDIPWYNDRNTITTARIAEGQKIRPVNCARMFTMLKNLTAIDLEGLDTSRATSMACMFSGDMSLTVADVSGFDTSNVTSMTWMFANCAELPVLDVSGFNTSNVTNMSYMFVNLPLLTELDVSHFDTSKVTTMRCMFQGCSGLTSIDLSSFDTSKVTNMQRMFQNCMKLTSLDVSGFDTSNVTDMSIMFRFCQGLTTLDVSMFDTSRVTTFEEMFHYCDHLESVNVSGFDTRAVKSFRCMFFHCPQLKALDISDFDTSSATDMFYFVYDCASLSSVTLGPQFSFKGNGSVSSSNYAVLPTPPSNDGTHNGKWASPTAGVAPQYTPEVLRDSYDGSTMAGTYVWAVSRNRLSFNANGGSGTMADTWVNVGESCAVPACGFTCAGLVFGGWNTKPDGSGDAYAAGASLIPTADMTLYAQWDEARIAVDVAGSMLLDLDPAGVLSSPQGCAIEFTNRGNVAVRVSGIHVEPASGMAIVANPNAVGEYEAWMAPDAGTSIKLSDFTSTGFVEPARSAEWTIPCGASLRVAGIGGTSGGVNWLSGAAGLSAGAVTWRFSIA